MNAAKQIEELQVNQIPFGNRKLEFLDIRNVEIIATSVGSVDLAKVVGTDHPRYARKTWGDLKPVKGTLMANILSTDIVYQPLKRAISNLRHLFHNPGYYEDNEKKERWSFYLIDGDYYIASGNNRTIIGRYYFYVSNKPALVNGVTVYEAKWKVKPSDIAEQKSSLIQFLQAIWRKANHCTGRTILRSTTCR